MPENHVDLGTKSTRKILATKKTMGVCPNRAKVCYGSRKAARKAVKEHRARGNGYSKGAPGRDLHEYSCDICGHWHIGH